MNSINCNSCVKETYDKVNIERVISKLDSLLSLDKYDEAKSNLIYWYNEAIKLNDVKGIMSILNEQVGLYRKINDSDLGIDVINKLLSYLTSSNISDKTSAVMYTNIATTYASFNYFDEALQNYDKANHIYKNNNLSNTYEYAAFCNNYATTLNAINKYDDALDLLYISLDILIKLDEYYYDIALTYLNICDVLYNKDESNTKVIEEHLDKAWEYISNNNNIKIDKYIYALTKCIPSFRYYKRELEAISLEEVLNELKEEH